MKKKVQRDIRLEVSSVIPVTLSIITTQILFQFCIAEGFT